MVLAACRPYIKLPALPLSSLVYFPDRAGLQGSLQG